MIRIVHKVGKEYVVANYPENDNEERAQQELARSSKVAQKMYQRVGLWVLAEMELGKYHIVITSINNEVSLSESDISSIQAEILERLKGESHAG